VQLLTSQQLSWFSISCNPQFFCVTVTQSKAILWLYCVQSKCERITTTYCSKVTTARSKSHTELTETLGPNAVAYVVFRLSRWLASGSCNARKNSAATHRFHNTNNELQGNLSTFDSLESIRVCRGARFICCIIFLAQVLKRFQSCLLTKEYSRNDWRMFHCSNIYHRNKFIFLDEFAPCSTRSERGTQMTCAEKHKLFAQ